MDLTKLKNDLLVKLREKKYFVSVSLERLMTKEDADYEFQIENILAKIEEIALIETKISYVNAILKDEVPQSTAVAETKTTESQTNVK